MSAVLIVVVVLSLALAAGFLYYGVRAWTRYSLMKNTPTSPCGQLQEGFAEAKGRLKATAPLIASPMSNLRCIYYRFKIEEYRRRGKSSHWVTLIDEKNHTRCAIDDGTGTADVELLGAEMHLTTDGVHRSGFLNDATPQLEQLLRDRGLESKGIIFNKSLRYKEWILNEGDELYVLGNVERIGGKRSFVSNGPVYIISDQGEDKIASSKLWTAVGCFLGTAAVLAGGVAMIITLPR